jgi:hypothetical protein
MKRFWIIAGVGTLAVVGLAVVGTAAQAAPEKAQSTPFNYKLDSKGNPVKKGKRTTNSDGSWREEIQQGAGCTKVREMSASGEYREHTACAPANPQ